MVAKPDRDEDKNGDESLQPPKRPNVELTVSKKGDNVQAQHESDTTIGMLAPSTQNDGLRDLFVALIRKSLLHEDSENHRLELEHVALVDLTGRAFLRRVSSFVNFCQERDLGSHGHIKVDLAFRRNGRYIEGWLYVRYMGTNTQQMGFKVRAQSALPLLMFKKIDRDLRRQAYLDKIMQKVHSVLSVCFSHNCSIVPLHTCDELWMKPFDDPIGVELRHALEQVTSIRKLGDVGEEKPEWRKGNDDGGNPEGDDNDDSEGAYSVGSTDDMTEVTDEEAIASENSWDSNDDAQSVTSKEKSPNEIKETKHEAKWKRRFKLPGCIRWITRCFSRQPH